AELGRSDRDEGSGPVKRPAVGEKNAYLFDPATSRRRAIIMALAAYQPNELAAATRAALLDQLHDIFYSDADAGVHSAAELLLKRWAPADAFEIEAERLQQGEPRTDRWYVSKAGHTMAIVAGPATFQMGAPPSDPDRQPEEVFHLRSIPRSF